MFDETQEWRNFEGTGNIQNRIGGKINFELKDNGLNTIISGCKKNDILKKFERSSLN